VDGCCELECALLTDVLGEVRYLTGKMRQEADTKKVCSEWKFAAMVEAEEEEEEEDFYSRPNHKRCPCLRFVSFN